MKELSKADRRIETVRLILRLLEREDAEPLARLWSDPAITKFAGGPRDFDTVKSIVEEAAKSPSKHRWTVVDKTTGKVIGDCGFVEKEIEGHKERELIYFFDQGVWNRGLATEAAKAAFQFGQTTLRFPRVVALIDPGNAASERVASKLGMVLEREVLQKDKRMRLYVSAAGQR